MFQWYAAYTNSRAEKSVYNQLQQKEIETFLPIRKVWRQYKTRKKKVDEVLFKSYIFFRISSRKFYEITKTQGVVKIISFEGKPAPIPEYQIDIIKRLIKNEIIFEVQDTIFSVGDNVEIIDGALKGHNGTLVNINGKYKVAMALEILNKSIMVVIDKRLLKFSKNQII